ncbi:MAG: response regulator transcription factor [Coriobacteriia bacterium]|nr:response regulator transcription factor [Coriobacteriia bacterium]
MGDPHQTVSVALIMENSLYRQGIAMLLESSGGVHVVGQASRVADCIDAFSRDVPQVVLLDLVVTADEGVDLSAIHECRVASPSTGIVVVSDEEDPDRVIEIFEAGAHAYVLRENHARTLIEATRAVARSEYVVDSRVVGALLLNLREMRRRLELYGVSEPTVPLTERQREMLGLVAAGYTNRRIANELSISESTVKNHLHAVFSRLGVSSRSQAISVAVRLGLVRP